MGREERSRDKKEKEGKPHTSGERGGPSDLGEGRSDAGLAREERGGAELGSMSRETKQVDVHGADAAAALALRRCCGSETHGLHYELGFHVLTGSLLLSISPPASMISSSRGKAGNPRPSPTEAISLSVTG